MRIRIIRDMRRDRSGINSSLGRARRGLGGVSAARLVPRTAPPARGYSIALGGAPRPFEPGTRLPAGQRHAPTWGTAW